MPRRTLIAASTTPDGEALTLSAERGEYVARVRGETLMSSRQSGSEQAMAELAFTTVAPQHATRILVAGLGMGFTLRAVLDRASARARVHVVELLADVVAWNRGPLAPLAGAPLDDPRVGVTVGDLLDFLPGAERGFDIILVDIDNGPEAFTVGGNARLYRAEGLAALRGALDHGGVMVLWSAWRSRAFEQRLRGAGFAARSAPVRARGTAGKGARHTLFVATRAAVPRDGKPAARGPRREH